MALTSGPNLGLLTHGNQGEQHYNELLRLFRGLDGLVLLSVADKDLASPPANPADGARYLIASLSPTNAWSGRSGSVARYSTIAGAWEFFAPKKGWVTHVDDENAFYRYTGAAWELWQGAKSAGWSAPTGTATRTAFDTGTATTQQLAERLKALIDDLTAQGRLGA